MSKFIYAFTFTEAELYRALMDSIIRAGATGFTGPVDTHFELNELSGGLIMKVFGERIKLGEEI